jgi:HAD superfamily hydrolase (TIGR01509 family)
MLQAILFDLDGTLANSDPIHVQIWQDFLREYGLSVDTAFYKAKFSGRLNSAILQELLPQLSTDEIAAFSDRKEAEFRRRAAAGELHSMPGLVEFLAWADNQSLQQAVVTNAPAENAHFMLEVLGLGNRFPTVVIGDQLERGKPDPMPYQVALERLGLSPQAAIAFEDSPTGIRAAIGAGILTIGVTSAHAAEELYALGVALAVPDFADPRLAEFLQFSFQQPVSFPLQLDR